MHAEIKSNYEKDNLYCSFQGIKPMLVLSSSNKYVRFINIPFLSKNLLLALQFLKDDSSSIPVNTQNCFLHGTPCLFQAIYRFFLTLQVGLDSSSSAQTTACPIFWEMRSNPCNLLRNFHFQTKNQLIKAFRTLSFPGKDNATQSLNLPSV